METGSPPVDSSTSSKYDDDNEVSSGDDEICLTDDLYIRNNFICGDKIGKGGFGFVYEVINKKDGKKYALKFVKLETDLAYREVQVLGLFDNKNVLKYHKHWSAKFSYSNSSSKASEEDDTSWSFEVSFRVKREDYSTICTMSNNNYPMSSRDDETSNTASSKKDSFTSDIINATSVSISNANLKIPEENDAPKTTSTEGVYDTHEGKNATNLSKSFSRSIKSSEEEHVSSYLVIQTELCQPRLNLKVQIESKKVFNMNENERRKLFLEIVYGLQHIHDKRVIHRDLKPANILIGIDDQEAKIADFGLARIYIMSDQVSSTTSKTDKDSLTSNLGTMPYVAPEVLKFTFYSYKADLYSLGIILSEMYLEMGSGRLRIMDRLRTQDFSDLKNIPEEIEEVIISLLSHEPSMRMELESVIDIMSPLEHHQRVEVEADQTEVFRDGDNEYQGYSGNLPSTLTLYGPFSSAPTEESQPDQSHSEDSDQLFNIY